MLHREQDSIDCYEKLLRRLTQPGGCPRPSSRCSKVQANPQRAAGSSLRTGFGQDVARERVFSLLESLTRTRNSESLLRDVGVALSLIPTCWLNQLVWMCVGVEAFRRKHLASHSVSLSSVRLVDSRSIIWRIAANAVRVTLSYDLVGRNLMRCIAPSRHSIG